MNNQLKFARFVEQELHRYQQPAWVGCLEGYSSMEKVLSEYWPRQERAALDQHIFAGNARPGMVIRSPDSDEELIKKLSDMELELYAIKDLIGTEGDRAKASGFEYAITSDQGRYVVLNDNVSSKTMGKLIKLGKSWGFLLFGYRSRAVWHEGLQPPCPDVLVLSVHKLDGYLLCKE